MSDPSSTWLEVSVECDAEAVEPVSELFAARGYQQGVVIEEPFTQEADGDGLAVDPSRPVIVRTFLAAVDTTEADLDVLRQALWHLGRLRFVSDLTVVPRQEEDWANAWKTHYAAHRIGPKTAVRPPWQSYEPVAGEAVVVLDPGMAFGTGLHPTTRLCVEFLEEELQPGDRVLDVGTGSGILAIAAVLHDAAQVDALDIEPVAVRAARENAARNGVAARLRIEEGSVGGDSPFPDTYPLVLANIIARILIELAPGLVAALAPDGTLLLSGIIESKEPAVRRVFDELGLSFVRRAQMEDWVALVYRRAEPAADAS